MLQGDRGQLRGLFTTQQQDALAAWAKSLRSTGPDCFLVYQGVQKTVAANFQRLTLDTLSVNQGGAWDASSQVLFCRAGEEWDITLALATQRPTLGVLQRLDAYLAEATDIAFVPTIVTNFWHMELPAGLEVPDLTATRRVLFERDLALKVMVRFSSSVSVNVRPGSGFTALSGTRLK